MAISSMTGFGRGTSVKAGYAVRVEISAVNRKQFDLRLNAPRALSVLEPQIVRQVRKSVARGGITIALGVDHSAGEGAIPQFNQDCANAYVAAAKTVSSKYGMPGELTAVELLRLPGVMQTAGSIDPDGEAIWPAVRDALKVAMHHFLAMRAVEGNKISQDMKKHLAAIRKLNAKVRTRAPQVAKHYRSALQKRISHLADIQSDPTLRDGIAREVALFADRCDITEELVRLDSHIDQSVSQLEGKGPSGRTLEFLCQEMLREINTMGSKANDARISSWVVMLKSRLEAFREQVQNVE